MLNRTKELIQKLDEILTLFRSYVRKRRLLVLVSTDSVLIIASMMVSVFVLMQNNATDILAFFEKFWWSVPLLLAFRIGVFRNFGLYHWAWQYMSVREVLSLIKAILISSLLMTVCLIALDKKNFPFALLVIEAMFCFVFMGGVRLLIRVLKEYKDAEITGGGEFKTALIVGAGDAGEMILREMLKLKHLKYNPIGFVDDSAIKKGTFIHRLQVLGSTEDIPVIVESYGVDEIIIALPTVNNKQIRRIIGICEQTSAKFKIVPGIFELIDGTVHVNQIRNVEIEDLLGREQVKLDIKSISNYLADSKILITGAGGSIGAELCRQAASYNPKKLILVGKGENSIFDIEYELKDLFHFLEVVPYIADIKDKNRLENIFRVEEPDIVFHAAAHKHVTLMENNPDEAVLNNIIGTANLVDVSGEYGVKEFVMISTDKAVNPTSVMGYTKRVAELVVQSKVVLGSRTKFVSVRFGNVLGSRGSVVQIFKKQIAAGGPVTVTHPEAKRYFMTIPEAVQLVIQAGAMGSGGETFILDMGEPVKIIDLARDLIGLSGLDEGIDIEIKYIGLKPGEKLFEEILTKQEGVLATKHEKIFIAAPAKIFPDKLTNDIKELENLAKKGRIREIKEALKKIATEADHESRS